MNRNLFALLVTGLCLATTSRGEPKPITISEVPFDQPQPTGSSGSAAPVAPDQPYEPAGGGRPVDVNADIAWIDSLCKTVTEKLSEPHDYQGIEWKGERLQISRKGFARPEGWMYAVLDAPRPYRGVPYIRDASGGVLEPRWTGSGPNCDKRLSFMVFNIAADADASGYRLHPAPKMVLKVRVLRYVGPSPASK